MPLFTQEQLKEMARTFDDVNYRPATKTELNAIVALYTNSSTINFFLKSLYTIK
jgi:hypothetical protein